MHVNHLASETSPYLLQHANNPVEWYPWNQKALQRAREENKPILLSIGYAACHWCHVMAHESFEDEETAVLLNRWFINIKVDREERPDLDKIYQTTHQLLSRQSGGWPLTIFLNPHDLIPFYTGTYFPREPRYGLPAFKQVLAKIADFYQQQQPLLHIQNQQLQTVLKQLAQAEVSTAALNLEPINMACLELQTQFDAQHGGFGFAPKFPQPGYLNFLLHLLAQQREPWVITLINTSLIKMAQGGIYDHLGGGFHRYSVDERWEIPHFEKMLYDNAQLLDVYAQAYGLTKQAFYAQTARSIATWILTDMQAPEGGYYATRDADSEGIEGKYYVWSQTELAQLLTESEYSLAAAHLGFDKPANFEDQWQFYLAKTPTALAQQFQDNEQRVNQQFSHIKQKLLQARQQRIPPLRDEKILTSWNGLMIKGMARAGITLQETGYIRSAQRAVDFIRQKLWQDGRLMASYKDGQTKHKAYLDDHAFLLDGLLTLLQADWRDSDLKFALELAEVLLAYYQDEQQGGFFFTAHDHEFLPQRPKPLFDEALPSGNAIATLSLIRLGHLVGNQVYLTAAEQSLKFASHTLGQLPQACTSMLLALHDQLIPPSLVILRGPIADLKAWQWEIQAEHHPKRLCFAIPLKAIDLPPKLASLTAEAKVTAYVCKGQQCLAPVHDLAALKLSLCC